MPNYWDRTLERKLDRRGFLYLAGAAGVSGALIACSDDSEDSSSASSSGSSSVSTEGTSVSAERPQGWVEATHGNVDPDFNTVFPSNKVNQLKLIISAATWQAMLDDMTALFGARGSGGGFGGQGRQIPQDGQMPQGGFGGGGGGMGAASTRKPMWVDGDVSFNGQTWTKVGIRFKGNSSLRSSWSTGNDSMPFKLDFDEWENDFPEVNNQRFYGFKQLSLSNNVGDETGMRETLAYDVFEAAGLPAANTAFYEILLDRGEGETSLGIYTAIEVVDDTMLDRVFGDDKGNVYEAEGSASNLAAGVAANLKNSFQKENNEDAADWSDVENFHSVLHSETRTSDVRAWREEMEAVFDVPVFLEWMAIATTIQHWDTYGGMAHNYYLYNDDGKLTWISWDHNFILSATGGFGGGGNFGGRMSSSLDKKEVTAAQWPLIRYLLDVPDYYDSYKKYLKETIDGPFNAAKMQTQYESWSRLLAPYADKEGTGAEYQSAVQSLIETTNSRNQAVTDFLAT